MSRSLNKAEISRSQEQSNLASLRGQMSTTTDPAQKARLRDAISISQSRLADRNDAVTEEKTKETNANYLSANKKETEKMPTKDKLEPQKTKKANKTESLSILDQAPGVGERSILNKPAPGTYEASMQNKAEQPGTYAYSNSASSEENSSSRVSGTKQKSS